MPKIGGYNEITLRLFFWKVDNHIWAEIVNEERKSTWSGFFCNFEKSKYFKPWYMEVEIKMKYRKIIKPVANKELL